MKSLSLPGTLDSLEPLADFLKSASTEAGLTTTAGYKLQLAVDEVVTNIIVHGYEEAGIQGNVELRADIESGSLTITVEDTAAAFDPTQQAPPADLDAPLETRNMGGLGVYLALKSVDQYTYERVGNRNRNRFVMRRG